MCPSQALVRPSTSLKPSFLLPFKINKIEQALDDNLEASPGPLRQHFSCVPKMCLLCITVQMSAFPHFPRITLSQICPSCIVPNLSGQAALLLASCLHYAAVFIKDCQHSAGLLCKIICSCKDTLNLAVALSLVKGIVCCYIQDESLQHQPATAVFATHFGRINNSCSFPCFSL